MKTIEKLLYFRGVSAEYLDYFGQRVELPHEHRLKFLTEVGYDVANDEAVAKAVYELDAQPWKSWLKAFNIAHIGESQYVELRLNSEEACQFIAYQITTESGELFSGAMICAELPEIGEYYLDGVRYNAHRYELPTLPLGYHQLLLSNPNRQEQAIVAVVPPRCYDLKTDGADSFWGASCQLYTLRSERNWGIGDFTDLKELVECCAGSGMDLLGLNPLHAPNIGEGDFASPYSPSDRRFLNPLYIDPARTPEFEGSKAITAQFHSEDFQHRLSSLRDLEYVDYAGVASLKYPVFDALFQHFGRFHIARQTERAKAFERYVLDCGESLERFSQYESLGDFHAVGLSPATAKTPLFHQYLQWLAHEQLLECHELTQRLGMSIGLMGDLAIGAARGGAEVACNPDLYCDNATIGAPPDPFAERGQNWNLPAPDPIAMQMQNYRHFIGLLAANMACCGALRIDHVMGLMRLWWRLPDVAEGAYVFYPLEDLLALVRLESHRNQCMVIGEDMGVVPDELRTRMAATSVYSNNVFYFETTCDNYFKPPQDHQDDALLMVTNHDVATLAGWWNLTDLKLRHETGLLNSESQYADSCAQRQGEKTRLLELLQWQQLLPESWLAENSQFNLSREFDASLCGAILKVCARSRSRLMLFQLDDLQLLEEPVNIPGTHSEYPNWRRKQRFDTRALFQDPEIRMLIASARKERKQ